MTTRIRHLSSIALCSIILTTSAALYGQSLPVPTGARDSNTSVDADLDPLVTALSSSIATMDATGSRAEHGTSESTITLVFRESDGDAALLVICRAGAQRLQALVQKLADSEEFAGIVSAASCSGSGYTSDPYKLQFLLQREVEEHYNSVPLLVPASFPDIPDTDSPTEPIPLGAPHTEISRSSLTLPEGWKAILPKPIHTDSLFASFDQTFTFDDGKLVAERKFTIKRDRVDAMDREQFEKWRQAADLNAPIPTVQFILRATPAFPRINMQTQAQRDAHSHWQKALHALEAHDLDGAQRELDEAKAIDPESEDLWGLYGDLAEVRGQKAEALADHQKELELHPNILFELQNVGRLQFALGQREEGVATLQRLISADPNYVAAPTALMNMYLAMERSDLALAVGDQAFLGFTEGNKKERNFLLAYANSQRKAGRLDAAATTLSQLISGNGSTNPDYVNEAAYTLAELGLQLPVAESAEREAIKQLETDDASHTPILAKMSPQQKTDLLIASWDTMGWIFYRENKFAAAESYLRAAWRNHQDPTLGKHLGDVLLALKQPAAALEAYELALASQPQQTASNSKATPDPLIGQLRAATEELKKAGAVSTITDAHATLAQLNTLDLGPAGKLHGESDYDVLLSPTGIDPESINPEKIEGGAQLIGNTKLPSDFFPKDSEGQLSHHGKLTCTSVCTLLILP